MVAYKLFSLLRPNLLELLLSYTIKLRNQQSRSDRVLQDRGGCFGCGSKRSIAEARLCVVGAVAVDVGSRKEGEISQFV